MSLASNLSTVFTRIGTEFKTIRTLITGSGTGDLSGLTTTTKTSLVAAINEVKVSATGAPPAASETTAGVAEVATQAEVNTGTADNLFVTPLKLAARLLAYAQPLSANLTTLAGVVSGAMGRTLLGTADAPAARTALGLGYFATGTDASNLTGQLGTAQLPPLAINETFTAASQAAMLALSAQRGDVAIRTDLGSKMYLLASDSPATLADWKPIVGSGDVTSVAGRVGAVVLTKTDVGLANVDNTSDTAKPVSTAQATALGLKMDKSANLSDVANAATARTNLSVYSQAEIGNPEADLSAIFVAALA